VPLLKINCKPQLQQSTQLTTSASHITSTKPWTHCLETLAIYGNQNKRPRNKTWGVGHKHDKVCHLETLVFLENIHKIYLNILNPWILLNQWSTVKSSLTSLHYTCFNMHLNTFFEMQILKNICHNFAKLSYKYIK
jgi:hypothetical protein